MSGLEQRVWSPEGRDLRPVDCNLCGSGDARPLAVENGLSVVRCRRCGLVYVTPQPSAAELAGFYAGYYPEESEESWRRIMAAHFTRDAERLEARLGGPGRALDVGTGFGHFPALLRERGWEVEAVESSPVAVKRLRERGIPVHEGQMPGLALPEARFDAIAFQSVLEHVSDPTGVLAGAHRALRPGGILLVRVPNVQLLGLFFLAARFRHVGAVRSLVRVLRREIMEERNLFSVIDPPGHLYGFSRATLCAALGRCGFGEVEMLGDPMHERGTSLNAFIDGAVYRGAELVRTLSRGRVHLAPNLLALARRTPAVAPVRGARTAAG